MRNIKQLIDNIALATSEDKAISLYGSFVREVNHQVTANLINTNLKDVYDRINEQSIQVQEVLAEYFGDSALHMAITEHPFV